MTTTPVANGSNGYLVERDESKRFPVDYAKFQEQYLDINGLFRNKSRFYGSCMWICILPKSLRFDPTNFSQQFIIIKVT